MTDWMDALITAAVRQGFGVTQTSKGAWHFAKDGAWLTVRRQPVTPADWLSLVGSLRGMGLRFPPDC